MTKEVRFSLFAVDDGDDDDDGDDEENNLMFSGWRKMPALATGCGRRVDRR